MSLHLNHLDSQDKTYRYDEGQGENLNLTVRVLFEECAEGAMKTRGGTVAVDKKLFAKQS
jgi:hypothetical protein